MPVSKRYIFAVATIATTPEERVVLVREKESNVTLGKIEGQFSLPAGKVNPGEKLSRAAAREFLEETGYMLVDAHQALTCCFFNREDNIPLASIIVFTGSVPEARSKDGELFTTFAAVEHVLCSDDMRPPMCQILEYWHYGEQRTEPRYPFSCRCE